MRDRLPFLVLLPLLGCPTAPVPPPPVEPPPGFSWGEPIPCLGGLGLLSFGDQAAARGLDFDQDPGVVNGNAVPCPSAGGVSIADLDGDGWDDLVFGDYPGFPQVFLNDGTGHFVPIPQDHPEVGAFGRTGEFFGAVAIDADPLLDLLVFSSGYAAWFPGNGDGTFGEERTFLAQPGDAWPRPLVQTAAVADVTGDGFVDVLLPVVQLRANSPPGTDPPDPVPGFDLLFVADGAGGFLDPIELSPFGQPAFAQVASVTDCDRDGDLDLFVPSEFGPVAEDSAFYRNDGTDADGLPILVNDAPDIGADLEVSGMGLDSWDGNEDGLPDYCVAQFGPSRCLFSDAATGQYVEVAAALGVERPSGAGDSPEGGWSAYGMEIVDLDNDGWPEMLVAAGPPNRNEPGLGHPDALFQGLPDGTFADRGEELGWDDRRRHYGVASSDLDGDGTLEVIFSGTDGPPVLWAGDCSTDAWIEVDLVGPPGDPMAYGAQVVVVAGDRRWLEERFNVRALNQSSARIHVGLGSAELVSRLEVHWPGGLVSAASDVPVRRRVVVTHPESL